MAIAYDAVSVGSATGTSLTVAHTCTGANLVLIVGLKENNVEAETCTGITYNGVALTKITGLLHPPAYNVYNSLWYLINPSTGANNIVASFSASIWCRASGVSYTGCKQSGIPDASGTNEQTDTATYNTSLTSVADNCWHIMHVQNGTGNHAAGTATTIRGTASDSNIADSNSAKTPAGSVTLQVTGTAATWDWSSAIITLAPYVAVGGLSIPVAMHHYKMMRN